MVYIMSGNRMESGPLTYDQVYGIAKKKNFGFHGRGGRDATVPNTYLQRGSTFCGLQRRQMSARAAVLWA